MVLIVYLAIYAGIVCFIAGCIRRILQYSRLPMHLRWELYPVPHEHPARAVHGGSYFESAEWSTENQRFHHWGEARAMVAEILFLRSLWESNRRLWYASFVFHVGLYCLVATCALVTIATALNLAVPAATGTIVIIAKAYRLTGAGGAGFVLLGAAGLLVRRLFDKNVRPYTTSGDILNLVMFVAAIGLTAAGYVTGGGAAGISTLAHGLVTFDTSVRINTVFAVGLVLSSMLVAYIPFTHMSHFIGKYFTFHAVRWDDAQNRRGGELERQIAGVMTYRPTWSATHIGADGTKTWPEIATANPAQEVQK